MSFILDFSSVFATVSYSWCCKRILIGGDIVIYIRSLVYADYYFLEALIRKGRIEKGENPVR